MFKKVLVPYDASEASERALDKAVGLVRVIKGDCKLILLHIVPEVHVPPSFEYGMDLPGKISTEDYLKELYKVMKNGAKQNLEAKINSLTDTGVEAKLIVLVGNAAEKILEYASAEKIDLIVIGNVGLRGISRIRMLGSVSRTVVENSPCPVMVVHPVKHDHENPGQ